MRVNLRARAMSAPRNWCSREKTARRSPISVTSASRPYYLRLGPYLRLRGRRRRGCGRGAGLRRLTALRRLERPAQHGVRRMGGVLVDLLARDVDELVLGVVVRQRAGALEVPLLVGVLGADRDRVATRVVEPDLVGLLVRVALGEGRQL